MENILKLIVVGCLLAGLAISTYASQEHDHSGDTDKHNQQSKLEQSEHDYESAFEGHHDEDHDSGDTHEQGNSRGTAGGERELDHGYGDHDENDEGVTLSSKQMALANINVVTLTPRTMDYQVYAPGEIKANGYTSYIVSPRVDSVVYRRHVALGDHVEKGQALVTLFSESVVEAQASYRVTHAEWRRVQQMGRKAVGDKRYVSAQTDHEAAYGRLRAYGLSEIAIQSIMKQSTSLGEYTLNAVTAGAVLTDDFNQGQRVESGEALMELADENELWVEARLAPNAQLQLPAGSPAQVKVGNDLFTAEVIQEAHTIDPQTRTRVVRLLVNNDAHRLHPGMFADVHFLFATHKPVLAVPESALMRGADGDWTVFVEQKTGQFKAQEIELGRSFGKWREIKGLHSGTRVVMKGAFFVASQVAKGGFDPHNH